MRIVFSVLFSGLLAANGLAAQAEAVHEYTLDNGLRLIVKEDHRAPVVVSQVWYKVGGSYEPAGKTGLSHMLEHMMFKGTERHPAGEFSRIMAANGATENAFTGDDYTAYYQVLEKSRLPISFEMEADRMRNLRITDEEFQKEHQVVIEERRLRTEDKPENLAYEHFMATAYQTSPYQNPVIGWMSDVQNLTVDDLRNWYRQWYAPNNAIVVVVGDVEPEAVHELAKQHFGPLPAQAPAQVVARPEVEQLGMKRITVKRPAELPYLLMGYKTPSLGAPVEAEQWEIYALEVLAWVLDGGNSARLSKHLLRGQSIASSVSAGYDAYSRLDGLFVFSGIPAQGKSAAELEAAIRDQIRQVQEQPVAQAELDRVKAQLVAGKVFARDSVSSQAYEIGGLVATGLDWRLKDTYLERVSAITPEQVQAVARKYLQDDGLTVAVLEPQPLPQDQPGQAMSMEEQGGAIR